MRNYLILLPAFVYLSIFALSLHAEEGVVEATRFVNPIGEGADPWVIRDPLAPRYLWCFSEGNRAIAIHASPSLSSFGAKHVIWRAPEEGPYSREVWAPELHYLDEHWYIYFAASDGDNRNHLTYVLRSETSDPLGEYVLQGPLATGKGRDRRSPNIWAIDMTVLEHRGQRYAIWSGWDTPDSDRQFLYIAEMESPTKLTGPRIRLCSNSDYLWERVEPNLDARGLHEAPQVAVRGSVTGITYSCGASWLPTYKLGFLQLVDDNPLDPEAWKKSEAPIFQSSEQTFGVGHSCFVQSPDQTQWWHIYHAKRDPNPGWRRAVFIQPFQRDSLGIPILNQPVQATTILERPSGEQVLRTSTDLGNLRDAFDYYGHHQFVDITGQTARLGHVPESPVNAFRCGEKLVLKHWVPQDFRVSVDIDFLGNSQARDAGLLFRCSGASIGYDAQRAYFAGLIPQSNRIILGRTDGKKWTELAREATTIDVHKPQTLEVIAKGSTFQVFHNSQLKMTASDKTYDAGSIGLRVVNSDAIFSNLDLQ